MPHSERETPGFRVAGPADVDGATDTITSAFAADPVWSLAFALPPEPSASSGPRRRLYRSWWRLFVEGALGHGWVWVTADCEAVAVWLPPGCPELGPEQEQRADEIADSLPGAEGDYLRAVLGLFEVSRPEEPHFYLSLLGTHRDHRGSGTGMALLRHTLARIDSLGEGAYLESTNPVNLGRYRSVGFSRLGEFALPGGTPTVTTMWRPPR